MLSPSAVQPSPAQPSPAQPPSSPAPSTWTPLYFETVDSLEAPPADAYVNLTQTPDTNLNVGPHYQHPSLAMWWIPKTRLRPLVSDPSRDAAVSDASLKFVLKLLLPHRESNPGRRRERPES